MGLSKPILITQSLIKYQMILDGVGVFNKNLRPHDNNLINQADDLTMVDQIYTLFCIDDILVDKDLVIKVKLSKYLKFDSFLDAEFSFCTV